MAEIEPPPKSNEPPKKAEKAVSQKSAEDQAIEEAKETIRNATSKDEAVRQKLRTRPVDESLDKAKEILGKVYSREVEWLLSSVDTVQSPELALFVANIAEKKALRENPQWLLAKTIDLAYNVGPETSAEARREINATIVKVKKHLLDKLITEHPDLSDGINETSFNEAMYGGVLIPGDKNVFKEDKPEEETITDPEIIRFLLKIDSRIRMNREYLSNPKYLEDDIAELQRKANERGVPESQMGEAIGRLIEKKDQINREQTQRRQEEQAQMHGEYVVKYRDIMETIPEQDRLTGEELARKEDFSFDRRYFSADDIKLITSGEEGQREYFSKFISEIYSMGKTFDRANLPEEYQFEDFKKYIKWSHPENTDYYLLHYDINWKDIGYHYQKIKNLLFTPGGIEDKLKGLRSVQGADLDFYAKTFSGSNYAISLYEETIRDLLAERSIKYEQAVRSLKTSPGLLDEYRKLAKARNEGRLSATDDLRLKELEEKYIDPVGYGVMLWDSDIQNYAELDLEVIAMNHELDRLIMKKKLSPEEVERKTRLDQEIGYKKKKMYEIKQKETDVHKMHAEDKGLSPVDKEVKRRLKLLLQDRDPEGKVGEWELSAAVWAARQWMMGSARLPSMSAQMAVRPAFEYAKVIKEINPVKYIMKAPAFEDIVRALNPDMFADRFGMGSRMGEVFRAQLERKLLEDQKFVFKHSREFEVPEEKEKLDPIVRETKEFIRQVAKETGIPYAEMLSQGFLKTGGQFDGTTWRAEMAAIDEMKKRYLDMQQKGQLPEGAHFDNQALGLQYAMKDTPKGKKEILDRMMKRTPSVIMQLLGSEELEGIYDRFGLTSKDLRDRFRRALSVAQINTWDREQAGDKTNRVFRDFDFSGNQSDFDEILKPFFNKEGFTDGEISGFFSMLGEVKGLLNSKKDNLVNVALPLTLTLSDINWKDAEMFQIGTAGSDRRIRDMGMQAEVMKVINSFSTDPVLACNKDIKKPLEEIKKLRDTLNAHTDAKSSEKATYMVAKTWLDMNRNRLISYENRERTPIGAVKGILRTFTGWVPFWHTIQKNLGEMDTSGGLLMTLAKERGSEGKKYRLLGKSGEKLEHRLEQLPHNLAQDVSYAVRFTGAKGNAFTEKELDEALDQMLQMGIFNAEEHLYHQLRKEMHATLGNQIVGLIRKYWWLLPLLTAAYGAKEGLEEEKKR